MTNPLQKIYNEDKRKVVLYMDSKLKFLMACAFLQEKEFIFECTPNYADSHHRIRIHIGNLDSIHIEDITAWASKNGIIYNL